MVLAACKGDTIILQPQNRSNYTNYRWYRNSVSAATEITAANAITHNIVSENFNNHFSALYVINTGGIYILTSQYTSGTNCNTINDTFHINYAQRPVVQVTVNNPTVCVGGSRTLNANLLAGSGNCTFQWQHSTDGVNWFNIGGETAYSFTPPSVPQHVIAFKSTVATMFVVNRVCLNPFFIKTNNPKPHLNNLNKHLAAL